MDTRIQMTTLNSLKYDLQNSKQFYEISNNKTLWLSVTQVLGNCSYKIKNGKDITNELIWMIKLVVVVASMYNVDLNRAWHRWTIKAQKKRYST